MKLPTTRSALHARAALMIPWLVNGSLPPQSEPQLREHIAACPECREDYEEQLRVCEAMRADGPLLFAAEPSYQKLLARMQNPENARDTGAPAAGLRPSRITHSLRRASPPVRWLAAAAAVQAVAIGLGAWAWHSSLGPHGAGYVTLTSAPPSYESSQRVRVLFDSNLSVGELQTLLEKAGAHIIDGPADGDVYTLGFAPPPDSAAALGKRIAALRANPAVLFAEPVQEGVR